MAADVKRIARKLTSIDDLVSAGLVPEANAAALDEVGARYAIALTPTIADLIDRDDPTDAIARQFLPDARELETHPAELADPIGDRIKSPAPGIVHRYPDRVLLKIASVCPVYCRFCFRREMVGPDNGDALSGDDLAAALDYIRSTPAIWEVILTGGDPFVLSPRRIRDVTGALSDIAHVKVLRWHTRVPVVDPARVTDELIEALLATRKTVFVGLHTNHVRELTDAARAAIAKLIDNGIPLVSQTVLLRGVNDDADTLEALMRALVELRVKPYYLHHGDLAPGTAHCRTTIAKGQALMSELRKRLSGLALPTYVLDLPGAHGKVPLETYAASDATAGRTRLRDAHNREHIYDDCCSAPDIP
jgi:lysine 2,3-aminomutase